MASFGDDDSEIGSLLDQVSNQGVPLSPDRNSENGFPTDADPRSDNAESAFSTSNLGEEASEDISDSDEESEDRENRFVGPSSTWRFFTENERSLAASLDQQCATDLSLHLYNAHALKSRVRDPGVLPSATRSRKKKPRIKASDDGSLPWHPEETWTSWPLKLEDIPKRDERFGVPVDSAEHQGITMKKVEAWDPRTDLEEEIQALMLRKATEKYREGEMAGILESEEANFLVDEDEADAALRPAARRILSRLDDLFDRLQENGERSSRSNSGSRLKRSRSKRFSEMDRPLSSTRRKNASISKEFIKDSNSEDSEATQSEESSSSKPTRLRRPLKPKDWKKVLSVAPLVAFDHAGVDRAAHRCASLFGESVELSTSYDCPIVECTRHGRPFEKAWRWREHLRRTHKYSLQEVYEIEAGSTPVDIEDKREENPMETARID